MISYNCLTFVVTLISCRKQQSSNYLTKILNQSIIQVETPYDKSTNGDSKLIKYLSNIVYSFYKIIVNSCSPLPSSDLKLY